MPRKLLKCERLSALEVTKKLEDDVTARTVRTDLNKLVEQGLVVMTGKARSSNYGLTSAGREFVRVMSS